jgi:hypothetical protein
MNGGFGIIMDAIALSVSILAVQFQGSGRSLGMCLRRSNVDGLMGDLTGSRIKHMYIIYILLKDVSTFTKKGLQI